MAFSYVALDVETSGLHTGVLLSVGMIIDRLGSRIEVPDLPRLNIIIGHEKPIQGEEVALAMNNALIKRIYDKAPDPEEQLVQPDQVPNVVNAFLRRYKSIGSELVLAGKNPAFDAKWLGTLVPEIKWHRRTIDPTILYLHMDDALPPNLSVCMERAGIPQPVQHDALADAMAIVKLIRSYFGDRDTK